MAVISRFLNKWLTPEEEEKLKIPSRRIFCIGALSTLALAAAPAGMVKLGNLWVPEPEGLWTRLMQINFLDDAARYEQNFAEVPQYPAYIEQVIETAKIELMQQTGIPSEVLRGRMENNSFNNSKILVIEAREEMAQKVEILEVKLDHRTVYPPRPTTERTKV